jgi:hypothetical protein
MGHFIIDGACQFVHAKGHTTKPEWYQVGSLFNGSCGRFASPSLLPDNTYIRYIGLLQSPIVHVTNKEANTQAKDIRQQSNHNFYRLF